MFAAFGAIGLVDAARSLIAWSLVDINQYDVIFVNSTSRAYRSPTAAAVTGFAVHRCAYSLRLHACSLPQSAHFCFDYLPHPPNSGLTVSSLCLLVPATVSVSGRSPAPRSPVHPDLTYLELVGPSLLDPRFDRVIPLTYKNQRSDTLDGLSQGCTCETCIICFAGMALRRLFAASDGRGGACHTSLFFGLSQ